MKEIDRFKGDRRYVHATDELFFAEPLLINARRMIFTSRKVGTCIARWHKAHMEDTSAKKQPIARLLLTDANGSRHTFECLQDTERQITKRIPFPEEMIANAAVIRNQTITSPTQENFTIWEHLSALHKQLLQKVISHSQWYFVRLEMDLPFSWWTPTSQPSLLSLHYRQQKGLLYLSDVEFDGNRIGEIGFAKR